VIVLPVGKRDYAVFHGSLRASGYWDFFLGKAGI